MIRDLAWRFHDCCWSVRWRIEQVRRLISGKLKDWGNDTPQRTATSEAGTEPGGGTSEPPPAFSIGVAVDAAIWLSLLGCLGFAFGVGLVRLVEWWSQ